MESTPDPNAPGQQPPQWPPPPQGQTPYAPPPQPDTTLGGLIPVNNGQALLAYYLGIFSFIPCLGIILGIAAFVLGRRGLAFAQQHPEVKGKTHAWVGSILGGFFGFGYLIALIAVLVINLMPKSQ